jgi:hypothetical protein
MKDAIKIKMRNVRSRFVALDLRDRTKVVAEGRTAEAVAKKAEKTGKPFSMLFVPAKGKRHIF